jgi:hypothetical protein
MGMPQYKTLLARRPRQDGDTTLDASLSGQLDTTPIALAIGCLMTMPTIALRSSARPMRPFAAEEFLPSHGQ